MNPQKILVSLPNWLGDVVMSLPTIKGMRWLFPESHLSVLVHSNFAPLFKDNQDINEVIPYHRGRGLKKFFSGFKIAKNVRKKRFDLVLILPRSFNSAMVSFVSNITERIGYAGDSRSILLTHSLPRDEKAVSQHRVYYFLNLLSHFGRHVPVSAPRLHIGKDEKKWVDETFKRLHVPAKAFLIGFNAGAAHGKAKRWLTERYLELAKRLIDKFDAHILLFGSSAESYLNSRILKKAPKDKVIDFSGQTDILQLAALIKRCRLLVTNDSGPMHMAAAMRTRVVAVFGPTDPVTTSPFGNKHMLIYKSVDCSPCHKRTCPTDHRCMKQVGVDEVFKACLRTLNK